MAHPAHPAAPSPLRRALLLSGLLGGAGWPVLAARALDPESLESRYPDHLVRIIVPTSPGGSNDLIARLVSDQLGAAWGQYVIVDQRTGANGIIATLALIQAPPDGHAVALLNSGVVQNTLLRRNPGYSMDDLAPVTLLARQPIAIAVGAGTGFTSLRGLLRDARSENLSYGTYGTGSGAHILASALARAAGVSMTHVPYRGESASYADLVSGRLDIALGSIGFYARQVSSGKVRVLAIASPKRFPGYPEIPTIAEEGFPSINLPGWAGLFMPAATPEPIVQKMSDAVYRIVSMPDMRESLVALGVEPVGSSPSEFRRVLATETAAWRKMIDESAIQLD